jgi:hypothetical protein
MDVEKAFHGNPVRHTSDRNIEFVPDDCLSFHTG